MRNKTEIEREIEKESFNWLGRKSFVDDFIKHVLNKEKSTHICLNGVWGSGKTTSVIGIMKGLEKIDKEPHPLILYLDAWKYEHYEEPLFALLKVIQDKLPDIFDKIITEFKESKYDLQVSVNLSIFNVSMGKDNENAYNKLLKEAEYVDLLHKVMTSAINKYKEEQSNELIIFIDELDRAKPDFALRTLEMFHHLQDHLPTHVVYSVDLNQLSSIIKHRYGYEYNVEIFTHKVFDEIISLRKLEEQDLIAYIDDQIWNMKTDYDVKSVRELILKYLPLNQMESLRTLNKVCESVVNQLKKNYFNDSFDFSNPHLRYNYFLGNEKSEVLWGYVELLIILIVYALNNPLKIYEFLRGENIQELLEYILNKGDSRLSTNLRELIKKSYNDGKLESDIKSFSDLKQEDMVIGLRKIFMPADSEYNRKSVFESHEIV